MKDFEEALSSSEFPYSYQDLVQWLDDHFGPSIDDEEISEEDIVAFVEENFDYLKEIYHADYALSTDTP